MTRRPLLVALLAATALAVGLGSVGSTPVHAQATEYTLETAATYRVDPRAGRIDVTVDATFTNTTPDPPGGYTIFTEALLAVHEGASEVRASDEGGPLAATAGHREGAYVATVTLREPIRYGATAAFRVTYSLVERSTPGVRVRPSGTVFTAWGFGTSSTVTVTLPEGYDVDAQGDDLVLEPAEGVTRLTSGAIANPGSWAAVVTAGRPGSFITLRAAVPLESATADIRVDAWADDEEWGQRTLDILVGGLPVLEQVIGLPYRQTGPLTVTESVSRSETSFDAEPVSGAEILLGFDQPPFTALHEAAHIWIGPREIESRWIYEGFASYFAAQAGSSLGIDPAFDPYAVRTENTALAFPLEDWPILGESTDDLDRYGYPASWALADEIAQRAGAETLGEVFQRVYAGQHAYTQSPDVATSPDGPVSPDPGAIAAPGAPAALAAGRLDGRRLLDHLEQVSGVAFDDLFARDVFPPDAAALLDTRRDARAAAAELNAVAAGWGLPLPVVDAMNAWDFAGATREMAQAREWLADRDRFSDELDAAGLAVPARLRERYIAVGGGAASQDELREQRGVLDAYRDARAAFDEPLNALERVGLIGFDEPDAQLDVAASFFERGEIGTASAGISLARDVAERAALVGALRIVTLFALVVFVALLTSAGIGRHAAARRSPRATLGG